MGEVGVPTALKRRLCRFPAPSDISFMALTTFIPGLAQGRSGWRRQYGPCVVSGSEVTLLRM